MRIGIVTLPLHANYGGILQAYAMKTTLESLGHQATVFDQKNKTWFPQWWKAPFIYAKRGVFRVLKGSAGPEVFKEYRIRREFPVISSEIAPFVKEHISPRLLGGFSEIKSGEYDAFVVGSDQVWRPKYFPGRIEDAFLAFADGQNVKRLSYAASFGTTDLEYDYTDLEQCSKLLSDFNAVSVRENSAVLMCSEWFDCEDAVHVLDPVLLLPRDRYSALANGASHRPCKGKVLSYILDKSASKTHIADLVAKWTSCQVHDASVAPTDRSIPLSERVLPSIEEWLSCFEDAEFVVTDSFHGCVLSLIFHKPFLVIGNASRGLSRFQSLLEMAGLEERIVQGVDQDDDGEYWLQPLDWDAIDQKLESFKAKSMEFLITALQ